MDGKPSDYELWRTELTRQQPNWEIDFASQNDLRQAIEMTLRSGDISRIRTFLKNRVGPDLFIAARAQAMVDLEAQKRAAFGEDSQP